VEQVWAVQAGIVKIWVGHKESTLGQKELGNIGGAGGRKQEAGYFTYNHRYWPPLLVICM